MLPVDLLPHPSEDDIEVVQGGLDHEAEPESDGVVLIWRILNPPRVFLTTCVFDAAVCLGLFSTKTDLICVRATTRFSSSSSSACEGVRAERIQQNSFIKSCLDLSLFFQYRCTDKRASRPAAVAQVHQQKAPFRRKVCVCSKPLEAHLTLSGFL